MTKKVTRDTQKAVVGGVAGGLARYYGQDPLLFRLGAIFALIITGVLPMILFYLIAWVFIPAGRTSADYTISHE
jgi:phage shock protein PspC (stress-responsive transcriptional regulator)